MHNLSNLPSPLPAELVGYRAISLESAVLWARLRISLVLKSGEIDTAARRHLELLYADLDSAIELAEERRDEKYSDALSERDAQLREDLELLSEIFTDWFVGDPHFDRFKALLQAAAMHKPDREIGAALRRLVNDMIDRAAKQYAEEEVA